MKKALVLFSGGQDSATCLAWALENFDSVQTVGFDYGQRHKIELDGRAGFIATLRKTFPQWDAKLKADTLLEIDTLGAISETSLTREQEIKFKETGLPSTFVPGRNLIFFTFAAALAYREGIAHLVGGMCETDFSGYPDCRNDTLQTLQNAISLGMGQEFVIETPLMYRDKEGTWALAQELGGEKLVELIRTGTHSCYLGERTVHEWGHGCGACPACDLRRKGFNAFARKAA